MASISQNQMTEEGKKKMFKEWEKAAPTEPQMKGWHGSLMSCADQEGPYYSCPVEDYNDKGFITQIGVAMVRDGIYSEKEWGS
jgi:hypothetical protein